MRRSPPAEVLLCVLLLGAAPHDCPSTADMYRTSRTERDQQHEQSRHSARQEPGPSMLCVWAAPADTCVPHAPLAPEVRSRLVPHVIDGACGMASDGC